jgi:hypothetical protein
LCVLRTENSPCGREQIQEPRLVRPLVSLLRVCSVAPAAFE